MLGELKNGFFAKSTSSYSCFRNGSELNMEFLLTTRDEDDFVCEVRDLFVGIVDTR